MVSERDGGRIPGTTTDRFTTRWIGGMERAVHDVTFWTYYTPNTKTFQGGANEYPYASCAASQHKGGVNCAYADGSVHFVTETITAETWKILGDRQDGAAVSLP